MNKILMWILIVIGVVVVVTGSLFVYGLTRPQVDKKPAIYLYPEQDSFVSVKVDINGKMIKDVPEYNSGWNVFATQEGIIDNKYDYLFYEAKLKKVEVPNEGWIIPYQDLDMWFSTNLPLLGLNEKEILQFKEYWLNELPESNYYEIKLLNKEFLEKNMNLIINPEPDTIIRLNFYFTPLKKTKNIKESIINTPERKGFTVVEWGGILNK